MSIGVADASSPSRITPFVMDSGFCLNKGLFLRYLNPLDPRKMHLCTMTSRHLQRGVYAELDDEEWDEEEEEDDKQ